MTTSQRVVGDRKRCANCRQWLHVREFALTPRFEQGSTAGAGRVIGPGPGRGGLAEYARQPLRQARRTAPWLAQTSQNARKYVRRPMGRAAYK